MQHRKLCEASCSRFQRLISGVTEQTFPPVSHVVSFNQLFEDKRSKMIQYFIKDSEQISAEELLVFLRFLFGLHVGTSG